ncbi:hypothetical protein CRUP_009506, partial [Coryphaenoides rupestris]
PLLLPIHAVLTLYTTLMLLLLLLLLLPATPTPLYVIVEDREERRGGEGRGGEEAWRRHHRIGSDRIGWDGMGRHACVLSYYYDYYCWLEKMTMTRSVGTASPDHFITFFCIILFFFFFVFFKQPWSLMSEWSRVEWSGVESSLCCAALVGEDQPLCPDLPELDLSELDVSDLDADSFLGGLKWYSDQSEIISTQYGNEASNLFEGPGTQELSPRVSSPVSKRDRSSQRHGRPARVQVMWPPPPPPPPPCTNHNVSSPPLDPHWIPFAATKISSELLYFDMVLKTDDWLYERPVYQYFLGDMINIEVTVRQYLHTPLRVFVESCMATAEPDLNSNPRYNFIDNY